MTTTKKPRRLKHAPRDEQWSIGPAANLTAQDRQDAIDGFHLLYRRGIARRAQKATA